eukprot:gene9335-1601_t
MLVGVVGLSSVVSEEQTRTLFDKCGKVQALKLYRDNSDNNQRTVCVEYENEQDGMVALHLTDKFLIDRLLKVERLQEWPKGVPEINFKGEVLDENVATEPATTSTSNTAATPISTSSETSETLQSSNNHDDSTISLVVYISGIVPSMTKPEIILFFTRNCGPVRSINIFGDGVNKPIYASMEFTTKSGSSAALKLAKTQLAGHEIHVTASESDAASYAKRLLESSSHDTKKDKGEPIEEEGRRRSRSHRASSSTSKDDKSSSITETSNVDAEKSRSTRDRRRSRSRGRGRDERSSRSPSSHRKHRDRRHRHRSRSRSRERSRRDRRSPSQEKTRSSSRKYDDVSSDEDYERRHRHSHKKHRSKRKHRSRRDSDGGT